VFAQPPNENCGEACDGVSGGGRADGARCLARSSARAPSCEGGSADGTNKSARAKRDAALRAIGTDAQVEFNVTLLGLYNETARYLGRLSRAVAEGRAVDEANNFVRWLQFSGVLELLERNAGANENFFNLRNQAQEVQRSCIPSLKGNTLKASPSQSTVDEINTKVDYVLSLLAKTVAGGETAPLQIVEINGRAK